MKLAERKAYLRTEGLTEKEQDKDEEVMKWLIRLQEIREKEIHDKRRGEESRCWRLSRPRKRSKNVTKDSLTPLKGERQAVSMAVTGDGS